MNPPKPPGEKSEKHCAKSGGKVRPVILERIESLGFAVFDGGSYDLNLFGIRAKNRNAGKFDDLLGCAWLDGADGWRVRYWPATTDPGTLDGELVGRWGEKGEGPGHFTNSPHGVFIDDEESLYVAEVGGNNRLQKFARV